MAQIFYPLGDYDLKVMRQEYYINRQKAVCLATYVDCVSFFANMSVRLKICRLNSCVHAPF